MDFLLFFALVNIAPQADLYAYNSFVPENIEYCANIIHNPIMSEKFSEQCNLETTNSYIMSVKDGI